MQVAIVKGLNRNLESFSNVRQIQDCETHAAATAKLLHFLSFLGDVKSFDDPASPDSAIFMSAFALKRSTAMYSRYVKIGYVEESGRREKRVSNSGAWW
jgi:hypothetical protein